MGQNNQWQQLANKLSSHVEVINRDDLDLYQAYTHDFGRLYASEPALILRPKSTESISAIVAHANQHQLQLTPRCLGLSQAGQSLAPANAAVLDLSLLNGVSAVDEQRAQISVQPGARWTRICDKSFAKGFLPWVTPFNLDLSVAGLISAGGIGASSHRYGAAACYVNNIEAVLANAEIVNSNVTLHSELFSALPASNGRFAIMTEMTLPLRPCLPETTTFYFSFHDRTAWFSALQFFADHPDILHIEAFATASIQGLHNTANGRRPLAAWSFALQLSIEHDRDQLPVWHQFSERLSQAEFLHEETNSSFDFANRHAPRFQQMKQAGQWQQAHPWFECFVGEAIIDLLPNILSQLSVTFGGVYYLVPINRKHLPEWLMTPDEEKIYALTVLPGGINEATVPVCLDILEAVQAELFSLGAKRYLSGYITNNDETFWQYHFGRKYAQWRQLKQQYDPENLLTSQLFQHV